MKGIVRHWRELRPWSCTRCRAGECHHCVDRLRDRVGYLIIHGPICSCRRKDHHEA